ncbi:hypothetical protein [Paenarthrobacter sp. NPDC089316]|uniref:hypothetical protein n=1 Tax=Paenarthrobacter sp. NPDC089316 TaxID=3154974 RepID=UPI0034231821
MMQDFPDRAAASMASTSKPVGVRLTETSIFSWGIPADANAARRACLSGLGLPATRVFSVDSTAEAVADTAGSALVEGLPAALAGGLEGLAAGVDVPAAGVVGGVDAAVQPVIMTAAAIISDHPARRTLVVDAFAGLPCFDAVPLLIT